MSKIAWVTGAAGFIGRTLCHTLLQKGWQVIAIDNLSSASSKEGKPYLDSLVKKSSLTFEQSDINSFKVLNSLPLPTQVFHLAATPGVRTSTDLEYYLKANQHSTQQLIQICQHRQIPALIFASSSSVYGQATQGPLTEKHICHPHSAYGQSKYNCEQDLALAAHKNFKVIALRLFSVYGPGQRPDMAFRQWAEALQSQQPVYLHHENNSTLKRDFTFVEDAVQGFIKASDYLTTAPDFTYQCFNIASGRSTDIAKAAHLLCKALGQPKNLYLTQRKAHPAEVFLTHANIALARGILDYIPRYNLEQGLKRYVSSLSHRKEFL